MRSTVVAALASSAVVLGLASVPAYAGSPSVSGVTVSTGAAANESIWAKVSWASENTDTQSVAVCVKRGTQAPEDSYSCDIRQVVDAPGLSTTRMKLFATWSYTFAVYATSSDQEALPVIQTWHGTRVHSEQVAYYTTYRQRTRLDVRVRDAESGHGLADQPVQLLARSHNTTEKWVAAATVTTDSTGRASATVRPTRKGMYRWAYEGQDGHLAGFRGFTLSVSYLLTARLTKTTAQVGEKVRIYGIVRPRVAKTVTLLQFTTTPYRGYARTHLKTTAKRQRLPNGRVTFGYTLTLSRAKAGRYRLQTDVDQDRHLDGGGSRHLVLTVTA
jgi:5-hydroxyisourate hydrolase-like protein (transthyretin family)